jgi:acetate kinase
MARIIPKSATGSGLTSDDVETVLVVNAGSTSLKLSAVGPDGSSAEVESLERVPRGVEAVAHRIVHGGDLRDPVVVDDEVARRIRAVSALAPLHNAPALVALAEAQGSLPDVPHVAVFDTAFHATIPPGAATYAIPARWREEWRIRRYGFHGLSVAWAAERVSVPRLIVCHLGGGCSVTAVLDGRSVDTTMGFTPLEGVPMATRSGSVDPGALVYLLRENFLTLDELERGLEQESGLVALGGTDKVGELEGTLALEVYVHRIAGAVSAMAAALGGLDSLVFTAGVGEGSPATRAEVCARLGFLGVDLDEAANWTAEPDADISSGDSRVRVAVVRAREDVVAARAARRLLYGE